MPILSTAAGDWPWISWPSNTMRPCEGETRPEIVRNVAYGGLAFSESRRRGGKGHFIPAAWPAIVNPTLWSAARAVAERRFARGGNRRRSGEQPYAFKGLLRCSCGERLHGAGKIRRKGLFFACRHGQ